MKEITAVQLGQIRAKLQDLGVVSGVGEGSVLGGPSDSEEATAPARRAREICFEQAKSKGASFLYFAVVQEEGLATVVATARAELYRLTKAGRAELEKRKKEILADFSQRAKRCYFSYFYPGSHEYTQEGFEDAQANERVKEALIRVLTDLNFWLELEPNDGLSTK